MSKSRGSFYKKLTRYFREWHRQLGILAAFFAIFLSLTGIALNHTDGLNLAHQPINNTWLLEHYGIKPPYDVRVYSPQDILVTDNLIWLDQALLLEASEAIISIGQYQDYILVVTAQQLFLYSQAGELIDQLDASSGVPEGIQALAIIGQQLIVKNHVGYFQTDEHFFHWQAVHFIMEPEWINARSATPEQKLLAEQLYQAQFLSLERIILDAHSGRLFGDFGVLFMDFIALLLILLSISGTYIWLRSRKVKR